MSKFYSLMPQQNHMHDFYSVRFAEYLTGKSFHGYTLLAITSLGFSLLVGWLAFFVGERTEVFTSNESEMITITAKASVMFLKYFVGSFFVFLLMSILHDWKDNFASRWGKNKDIVSAIILCVVMVFLVIAWFLTKDTTNIVNMQLNCNEVSCNKSVVPPKQDIHLKDVDESIEPSNNEYLNKYANLSVKEFDELFNESGFKDVSAVDTSKRLAKGLESISLFKDSKDTEWDMFLSELEEARSYNPTLVDSIILNGLIKRAPFTVIKDIVGKGHQLNGSHVSILVKYFDVDELKTLENYGVDLSLTSSAGSNALIGSMLHQKGPDVFEYLLNNDDLVLSEDVDVLREVLMLSSQLGRPIIFAQKLIDRGAKISEDTIQWIEQDLKKSNPRYHSLVKSQLAI